MRRFQGQPLPGEARIAVIANDALGNYVVATPLLQALKRKFSPQRLDFFSGERTEELWSVDPNIDAGFRIMDGSPRETAKTALERVAYDLVVNLESSDWARSFAAILCEEHTYVVGQCLTSDGRSELPFSSDLVGGLSKDRNWTAADLTTRYPMLCSGFIGEIFCRMAYLDGPIPPYKVPSQSPGLDLPPLLISASASSAEKLWPTEKWFEVLQTLRAKGMDAGLLGAGPSAQRAYWTGADTEAAIIERGLATDFRGLLTLPQVVGALCGARAVLSLDNGIMHLAAATKAPIVALFRNGYDRLWAPPVRNLTCVTAAEGSTVAEIDVCEIVEACMNAF